MQLFSMALTAIISLTLSLTIVKPIKAATPTPLGDLILAAHNGNLSQISPLIIAFPTPLPLRRVTSVATAQMPVKTSDFDPLFDKYASQFNISVSTIKKIAYCESKNNPQAVSRTGAYVGLFQFAEKTWVANRQVMGLDPNPTLRTDPEQAIMTAAFKIAAGGIKAWPVCGAI